MNDNEIIKALEYCNSTERGKCLNKCPYYDYSANCSQRMIDDALDLINRQKAEIEHITEKFKCQQAVYADLSKIIKEQAEKLKTVKSEAIKEFTERLKNEITDRYEDIAYKDLFFSVFDKLVNEMVGENNA